MKNRFKQWLLGALALLLIVEEWLWDLLTVIGSWLAWRLHLERFERWLQGTSRYMALLSFAIPVLVVTPLNFYAFAMIAKGHVLYGVVLEIFVKLLATMLVARVFALTRRQLMTFGWFAWLYRLIMGWLRWAHERLAATVVYREAKLFKMRVRQRFERWRTDWWPPKN